MPEEIGVILENLKSVNTKKFGDLTIYTGEWISSSNKKIFVSTAWSGWGKVSAARASTRLMSTEANKVPMKLALFTGVAGGIDKKLNQWDIVISDSIMQHDMDASPLFEKHVIPPLNKKKIYPNKILLNNLFYSIDKKINDGTLKKFGALYKGLIATGDMFINDQEKIKKLSNEIDGLLAVEMEGGAFAQVATQEKVEWLVLRVISDGANEIAVDDFKEFIVKYKLKSFELIKCFLEAI